MKNINTQYGVVLEASASKLTHGSSGKYYESYGAHRSIFSH